MHQFAGFRRLTCVQVEENQNLSMILFEPVNGIVRPRATPPLAKPTRHTNQLDYILNTGLKEVMKHKQACPLNVPVDAVKLKLLDYHKVIRRPMDMKTIYRRLQNICYYSAKECMEAQVTLSWLKYDGGQMTFYADGGRISFPNRKNHPPHIPTGPAGFEVFTFYPSLEEFKDFKGYVQKIEAVGAHRRSGICKRSHLPAVEDVAGANAVGTSSEIVENEDQIPRIINQNKDVPSELARVFLIENRRSKKYSPIAFPASLRPMSGSNNSKGDDFEVVSLSTKRAKVKREVNPADVWTDTYKYTLINEVMACPSLWDVKLAAHKNAHITTADCVATLRELLERLMYVLCDSERKAMDDSGDRIIELMIELLVVELISDELKSYINPAHIPHLDTRFRIFDSYLASNNPSSFLEYVRLLPNEFESLHERLAGRLSHLPTHLSPISTRHRLCIFLRFIGHGNSYAHMSGEFAVGHSTVCRIVKEVAQVIVDELHDCAFPLPTPSTWSDAVESFSRQWDYPVAMGALDGKHISCVCPVKSGSRFFNYKGYYSIVLLALVDGDYRCVLYDLGAPGRTSDAGVFMTSSMKAFLDQHEDDFPAPIQLGNVGRAPCHFLIDQGFRLTTRFIRPYSNAEATMDSKKAYFNFRLSRARRVGENYFGLLASRFRLLLRPIYGTPEAVKVVTLAIMILHNLLINSVGRSAVVERFGFNSAFEEQEGRGVVGNIANEAKRVREQMKTFFCRRDHVR